MSSSVRCVLAALVFAIACTPEQVAGPAQQGLEVRTARPSASAWVAQEIGVPTGDGSSEPLGVNDFGHVVGRSFPASGPAAFHAFLQVGSTMTVLSDSGSAMAISSGSPIYITGSDYSPGYDDIARWAYDPSTGTTTQAFLGAGGAGRDINDAGTIVGTSGTRAVVWPLGADPTFIDAPAGFTHAQGRGINNAGHLSLTFQGVTPRGFLKIGSTMIELIPGPGHTMSFSGDVSEPVNGIVYVAGISAGNVETDYHLARWKVDVGAGTVVSVEVRGEVGEGGGVSNAGAVAGQKEGKQSSTAFVWSLTTTTSLKATKGGTNTEAVDMSANGRYVIGTATYSLRRRGLLWVNQSP